MCGICGFVSFAGESSPDVYTLGAMCQTLIHRGPDDSGTFANGHAHLGMRRLSIIDLATGRQPMRNEDGTIWCVFNGEIYNYRELRADLEERGHRFTTQSDTEVIVHAYESFGPRCVEKFNGMFTIALWDESTQQLFLARDRLGIKPLYYWSDGRQLVFGSELKALLRHPAVPREVDLAALDHFLALEYIPAPLSILRDVYKLPAGHWLLFQDTGRNDNRAYCRQDMYWDIPDQPITSSAEECVEQLRELIDDAVRLRLISDVPLGAFLSGGIDSSTIVESMSRAMDRPVKTFSIGFGDPTYNELPYARAVAKRYHTEHTEEMLQPNMGELVHKLLTHLDEPLGDFSIFPTFLVSQLARQHVTVALSGDGGDELFGGYDTYVAQRMDRYYRWLPAVARRQLSSLFARIPPRPAKKGLFNKTQRFLEGAALPPELQHTRWMIFLPPAARQSLYHPAMWEQLEHAGTLDPLYSRFQQAAGRSPLAMQQYVDVKSYLVDNILTKVDRMSMAASLEARVPLLDHRIVEFALNLPDEMKLRGKTTKWILRQAMTGRLPDSILRKPKEGFSIPLKHWLRGPLRPLMNELLSPAVIQQMGYFRPETIQQWLQEHQTNRANHSHRLWALMVFTMWHNHTLRPGTHTTPAGSFVLPTPAGSRSIA